MILKNIREGLWNNAKVGTHTELLGGSSFCKEDVSVEDLSLLLNCQESSYI